MGVGSIDAMYQPYIDGKLELAEVNMLHAATTFTLGGGRSASAAPGASDETNKE